VVVRTLTTRERKKSIV